MRSPSACSRMRDGDMSRNSSKSPSAVRGVGAPPSLCRRGESSGGSRTASWSRGEPKGMLHRGGDDPWEQREHGEISSVKMLALRGDGRERLDMARERQHSRVLSRCEMFLAVEMIRFSIRSSVLMALDENPSPRTMENSACERSWLLSSVVVMLARNFS